jgi:hypothetical protein
MAIQPPEPTSFESQGLAASELAVATHESGNGRVAILLAIAAVAAALIGARASMISNDANDTWQSALRTAEKRSAGVMNDTQYLYEVELPIAAKALQARLVADQLASAAPGQSPDVAQALNVEAGVQGQMADTYGRQVDLSKDPKYTLPSGGFDLGKRMADIRAENADLANLDPDAIRAAGDALANKAVLLTYALLPTSFGALLGVLAQPLRRYRTWLLLGGSAATAGGVAMAIAVEVLA